MRVYVAGPLSTGTYYDCTKNIRHAIDVGDMLLRMGYAPYIPHYSHFWNLFHPHTWQEWMEFDKEWLAACDVLLRLPGESKGADQEVSWAMEMGIPIVHTFGELDALRDAEQAKLTGPYIREASNDDRQQGGPELLPDSSGGEPSQSGGLFIS